MFLELFTTKTARSSGLQMSILTGPSCRRPLFHLKFISLRIWRTKSAVSARSLRLTVPEAHSEIETGSRAQRLGRRLDDATCLCTRREHEPARNSRSREFVFYSNPGKRKCDSVHHRHWASTQA